MIKGDARVSQASFTGEVTHFGLTRTRYLQLKGCLNPQLIAILQRGRRDVFLKYGKDLF